MSLPEGGEICGDWREAGRGFASRFLVICRKSKGHTDSNDPKKREHYDPDADLRWTDNGEA